MKIGDMYESYEDFLVSLKKVENATYTKYTIVTSNTVKNYNSKLAVDKFPLPARLQYYTVTLGCKHYGDARSRSQGIRPSQFTYKIECTAAIKLGVDKSHTKLQVKDLILKHNHTCLPENYKFYPESRRKTEEEVKKCEEYLSLGVNPPILRDKLQAQSSKVVLASDIRNDRARFRKKQGTSGTIEALIEELQKMQNEDPTGSFIIGYEEGTKELQFLYLCTTSMKKIMQLFPTIQLFDITYNTNDRELKLFVGQSMDGHGRGRVVCYIFMACEKAELLKQCLQLHVEVHHPFSEQICCIIVDKDFSEICAIREILPWAHINICVFHVSKTFHKKCRELVNEDLRQNVMSILVKMYRYADTEDRYTLYYSKLMDTCGERFKQYFLKNWHPIRQMWTPYGRVLGSPNFGVATTNPVESHNGKLKTVCSRRKTMVETVRGLMLLDSVRQTSMSMEVFKTTCKKAYFTGDDEERQQLLSIVTPYAIKLMVEERERAKQISTSDCEQHSTTVFSCLCYKRKSLALPCAHMIMLRQQEGMPIFDTTTIHKHWKLENQDDPRDLHILATQMDLSDNEDLFEEPEPPIPRKKKKTSPESKFNESMTVCKEICGRIQFMDENTALEWQLVLLEINKYIKMNSMVAVLPNTRNDGNEGHQENQNKENQGETTQNTEPENDMTSHHSNHDLLINNTMLSNCTQEIPELNFEVLDSDFNNIEIMLTTPHTEKTQCGEDNAHELQTETQNTDNCISQAEHSKIATYPLTLDDFIKESCGDLLQIEEEQEQNSTCSQNNYKSQDTDIQSHISEIYSPTQISEEDVDDTNGGNTTQLEITVQEKSSSIPVQSTKKQINGLKVLKVLQIDSRNGDFIKLPEKVKTKGRPRLGPKQRRFKKKVVTEVSTTLSKESEKSDQLHKMIQQTEVPSNLAERFGISKEDWYELVANEELSDNIINAAQNMIKHQFPQIQGLNSVGIGQVDVVESGLEPMKRNGNPLIQILQVNSNHWITMVIKETKIDKRNEALMFNSMKTKVVAISSKTEQQIAKLISTNDTSFTLRVLDVCQQSGDIACGDYSIAFALDYISSYVQGKKIKHVEYDQSLMREHLKSCLINEKLTLFPRTNKKEREMTDFDTAKINVWCVCRLPEHYDTDLICCTYCKGWFHPKCVSNTEFEQWQCSECILTFITNVD